MFMGCGEDEKPDSLVIVNKDKRFYEISP